MTPLVAFIVGLVVLGLLLPKSVPSSEAAGRGGLPFGIFVATLAASPIIGGLFAIAIGIELSPRSALSFSWIGIVSALPLSLLVARVDGKQRYANYWNYIESSSKTSKRRFMQAWIAVSLGAFILGMFFLGLAD